MRLFRILSSLLLLLFLSGEEGFGQEPSSNSGFPESRIETGEADEKLSAFVRDPAPWLNMPADSEQRQPVYLGSTPREMTFGLPPEDEGNLRLDDILRSRGENQIKEIHAGLVKKGLLPETRLLQMEAWPARNDDGLLTWTIARWRITGDKHWIWLQTGLIDDNAVRPPPILPELLRPQSDRDASRIFDDFMTFSDLYQKPVYGNCLWTDNTDIADNSRIVSGWNPPRQAEADRLAFSHGDRVCRVLPQPSRWNGRGITMLLEYHEGRTRWPEEVKWKGQSAQVPLQTNSAMKISSFPGDFLSSYRNDLLVLSGESEAVFPESGRRMVFRRKNSADRDNQLRDVASYLEERYKRLGIETVRQSFSWRGIPQENLIARIRGSGRGDANRPILMADHLDSAFCEDEFASKGERISSPGGDDNASGTAALLRAAEILKASRPVHDIWFVHLTGEEFPADSLGARHFLGEILKAGQDIGGLVLLDMIGHREGEDRSFQIHAGNSAASLQMAAVALDASLTLAAPNYVPVLRKRHEERSYLYNTDGLLFSEAGFSVVLINERLNALENMDRKGYHDCTDTSKTLDWEYAAVLAKVAIETIARLAGASAPLRRISVPTTLPSPSP